MKTILVTGFPHCGTSILRAKIGECDNVYDDPRESRFPSAEARIKARESKSEFLVWKDPLLPHPLFKDGYTHLEYMPNYKNRIIFFILRNPYYAFSSLVDGWFMNPYSSENQMLAVYERTAKIWLDFKENPHAFPNVYPIRYEDMFDNDFKLLKDIFNEIGLKYSDDIFLNRSREYEMVSYRGKAIIREAQINKPFVNNNGMKEVKLSYHLTNNLDRNLLIQNKLGYKNPLKEK